MKTPLHVLLYLVAALVPPAAFAHNPDPADDGWVRHVEGRSLEICYRDATPPAIGETVQILHTSYITTNKGTALAQYTPTGAARITSGPNGNGCETAELIDGKAHRTDHARGAASRPAGESSSG